MARARVCFFCFSEGTHLRQVMRSWFSGVYCVALVSGVSVVGCVGGAGVGLRSMTVVPANLSK